MGYVRTIELKAKEPLHGLIIIIAMVLTVTALAVYLLQLVITESDFRTIGYVIGGIYLLWGLLSLMYRRWFIDDVIVSKTV